MVTEPEELVSGDGVEFRFWDAELDATNQPNNGFGEGINLCVLF